MPQALLEALLVCLLLRLKLPLQSRVRCWRICGGVCAARCCLSGSCATWQAAQAAGPFNRALQFSALSLLGLCLQSGLLTLMVDQVPPQAAIFPAAAGGAGGAPLAHSPATASTAFAPSTFAHAVGFIAYAFALRLVFAATVELMPEETYYWNYAQHLDWGYLDHPPMVAWLIHGCTLLLGQSEFAVRLSALLCGAVASFFIYRLTRNLFGREAALAALLLAQGLPFFFLAGLLITPDAPLTAAWAASLYFLERALVGTKLSSWWFAGLCLGLGLVSKYTILILGSVAVTYMLWDAIARRWWLPAPYGRYCWRC